MTDQIPPTNPYGRENSDIPNYAQQNNGPAYVVPPPPAFTAPQDILWASISHLLGIFWFVGPLIVWLFGRERGSFTNIEGKESLNFQLTVTVAWFGVWVISWIPVIGTMSWWVVAIGNTVLCILGYLRAKIGYHYRYPFSLRLIK